MPGLRCRDKLAQAEKRVEVMTAAMRSANPLTPFDFPMAPASTHPCSTAPWPTVPDKPEGATQAIPAAHLPQFQDVEMVVSRGAMGGWVEQASPACGAASVAGAWNAIKPQGKQALLMSTKAPHSETHTTFSLDISSRQQQHLYLAMSQM